jgi:hypothetical protein
VDRQNKQTKNRIESIHRYMEMSQEKSLCSDLKQTKMSFFFFFKMGEEGDGTGLVWGGGHGTSGMGEEMAKRCGRDEYSANIMHIYM